MSYDINDLYAVSVNKRLSGRALRKRLTTLAFIFRPNVVTVHRIERPGTLINALMSLISLMSHLPLLQPQHLRAAEALIKFSTASVKYLFGDITENSVAKIIRNILLFPQTPLFPQGKHELF